MGKTAIILGATGLTGKHLLTILLQDDDYNEIKYFGRSSLQFSHPKLTEHVVNLFDINQYANEFTGDVVFCCIGTTSAKTPDYELYQKIDKGIPLDIADLCEENGISTLMVMSSMGAHPDSAIEYSRIKGEMEEEVALRDIKRIFFIEPSMIGGKREEVRLAESVGKLMMAIIDPILVGPFARFKMIEPEEIAKAMLLLDKEGYHKMQVESNELLQLSKDYENRYEKELTAGLYNRTYHEPLDL